MESSLSRTDLQEETRLECLRHAAFLMILSREGPRTRPHREGPPRVCEADIVEGSFLSLGIGEYQRSEHSQI